MEILRGPVLFLEVVLVIGGTLALCSAGGFLIYFGYQRTKANLALRKQAGGGK